MEEWRSLGEWWSAEVERDPAYREEVLPLLEELLEPQAGELYLDLGCGEGQAMRLVASRGGRSIGCDLNPGLLARAKGSGPLVRCRLPHLAWLRPGWLDGAFCVLVLEHLDEVEAFFRQTASVVSAGGRLVVISNHPAYTAPGSGPVVDPDDGEVLWRWGPYLKGDSTTEPAGGGKVTIFHRPLGTLLTSAARAGWRLERLEERGVGEAAVRRDSLLLRQRFIPRLLGVRWSKP